VLEQHRQRRRRAAQARRQRGPGGLQEGRRLRRMRLALVLRVWRERNLQCLSQRDAHMQALPRAAQQLQCSVDRKWKRACWACTGSRITPSTTWSAR